MPELDPQTRSESTTRPTLYIAGPTASGKTGVSVELALRYPGAEIINADAYQAYDALPTLTARPVEHEHRGVPHHLFGTIPVADSLDAQRHADLARAAIRDVQSRGGWPIVVGGSGLYVKAMTYGLSVPGSDPELRAELAKLTPDQLVDRLVQVDPEGAAATNLKNPRYVIRNLEICLASGKSLAEARAATAISEPFEPFRGVFLRWPRDELYDRINARTVAMFDAGVVEEVAAIPKDRFGITAERMIGLREIWAMLAGDADRETTIAAIQQATRRYAKRQGTWFRREEDDFNPVEVSPEDRAEEVADRIESLLDN